MRALATLVLAATAHAADGAVGTRAVGDSSAHNLIVIEFRESPTSDLAVSGGLLGVPDSTGGFPASYRRFDPVTGQSAPPGRPAGSGVLVFTDLHPGTYRVALILLEESRTFRRFFPKEASRLEGDHCLVYGDTASALTFTVGHGEIEYLGRVTRRTRPSLGSGELWQATIEWTPGDERRTLRALLKRKDLASWHELLRRRLSAVEIRSERSP